MTTSPGSIALAASAGVDLPPDGASADEVLAEAARRVGTDRPPRPMTTSEFVELLRAASTGTDVSGTARARHRQLADVDGDHQAAAREWMAWMADNAAHLRATVESATPPSNPARVRGTRTPTPLTGADLEWIRRLDASSLTDDAVATLARMERDAANESDLRLVRHVLAPRRRELDEAEERAVLRASIDAHVQATSARPDRNGGTFNALVGLLAPWIQAERRDDVDTNVSDPAVRERLYLNDWDALREAEQLVRSVYEDALAPGAQAVTEAHARLAALDGGAEPSSSMAPVELEVAGEDPEERGRDRARRVAEQRAEASDAWDELVERGLPEHVVRPPLAPPEQTIELRHVPTEPVGPETS